MVSSQVIKGCLEEIREITRIEFCVQDANGNVVASTPGVEIPESGIVAAFASSSVDSQIIGHSYLLKVMDEDEIVYVLTATGDAAVTFMVARMAVSELQNLIIAYKEKYDRNNFFQNLLLDNLLLVDIYNRAKKLHIVSSAPRAIILFELEDYDEDRGAMVSELLLSLFTAQNGDYLTQVDEHSVILIKSVNPEDSDPYHTIDEDAARAVDTLESETMTRVRVSYGTIVGELRDLSKSYKEARMAMDVGQIFHAERRVISYNELGIGRLIYQLPTNLCRMFIREVFGDTDPGDFEEELLTTVNTFFANNLNVSETARQLFVHRNTLVYRIEKLQKTTGLDIRTFEDAMTFKIALMVSAYLHYIERKKY